MALFITKIAMPCYSYMPHCCPLPSCQSWSSHAANKASSARVYMLSTNWLTHPPWPTQSSRPACLPDPSPGPGPEVAWSRTWSKTKNQIILESKSWNLVWNGSIAWAEPLQGDAHIYHHNIIMFAFTWLTAVRPLFTSARRFISSEPEDSFHFRAACWQWWQWCSQKRIVLTKRAPTVTILD